MRILAFSNLFPNEGEPVRARFNYLQFSALNALTDVSVGVISPVEIARRAQFWASEHTWGPRGSQTREGLEVSYPTAFLIPRILRFLNGWLMALSVLPAWLREWRKSPDVVFATWAFPDGFAAVFLGKLFRLPVFVKVHGTDVAHLLGSGSIRRWLTIRALSNAEGVIAVSDYLRDQLIACGVPAERVTTIYNGLDRELFQPGEQKLSRSRLELKESGRIGLFVGNLEEIKGVHELIAALTPELCAKFDLDFYLIGRGPLRSELQQKISAIKHGSVMHLLGPVAHADLPDWMRAADFLCLPSHHEGMPNVLLEALACGLPVVASRVGGIPEIVNDTNGTLVSSGDVAGLTQAITAMLEQGRDRTRVSESLQVSGWAENAAALAELFVEGSARA